MDRKSHGTGVVLQVALCLYAVTPLGGFAQQQQPTITNVAGPTASSSGSVVNQGVQVLNGPYMTQSYGGGVMCQTASFSLTPFVNSFVNMPWDPASYGAHTFSPGLAATFNIPLNGEAVSTCLERAKAETERQKAETAKARLDFELVRLLRCGEAKKAGVDFHPSSPYAKVCADVVLTGRPSH